MGAARDGARRDARVRGPLLKNDRVIDRVTRTLDAALV